jgi:hypothetical protein
MSSNFPLYTTLFTNLPRKDLTIVQKNDFIRKVADLDSKTHELLYALIKCYFLENDSGEAFSIPYNGKLAKDRIEFNLLDFPPNLKQLLYKFVMIHQKKLLEDQKLLEIQNNK